MSPAAPDRPRAQPASARIGAAVFGGLGGLIALLLVLRELDLEASIAHRGNVGIPGVRYSPGLNDDLLGLLCAVFGLGILLYALLRHRGVLERLAVRRLVAGGLIAATFLAGLIYFYGGRGLPQSSFPKIHDSFHYATGAKYFAELGHYQLYRCAIQADAELGATVEGKTPIRDLESYRMTRADELMNSIDCRELFSEDRWQAFKSDIGHYRQYPGHWPEMLRDRGYNGTPFHALISGALAHVVPELSYPNLVLLSLLDIAALCVMFFFVTRAFGWKVGLLFAGFFFVNYVDRFYFTGASHGRFLWMATLGIGLAMLKERRYGAAGVLITTSAMLNVFPLLFFAGIGIKALWELVRHRRLRPAYRRFIAFSVAATIVLGAASISHGKGIDNYRSFFATMSVHTDLITRSRIGIDFAFLYRGEVTPDDRDYGAWKKKRELKRHRGIIAALKIALLGFAALVLIRLDDIEASVLGGFLLFFVLFITVEYYYAVMAVLVLLWHARLDRARGMAMLALLFAGMGAVHICWHETRFLQFCNNTATSLMLTSYLLVTLVYLAWDTGLLADIRSWIRRRRGLEPAVADARNRRRAVIALIAALLVLGAGPPLAAWGWWQTQLAWQARHIPVAEGPVFAFGGDVNLGRRQNAITALAGPEAALTELTDLRDADAAVVNLESVIATGRDAGAEKGEGGPFYFRARPETAQVLAAAGIDGVSTANNHSGDYGPDAASEQIHWLDRLGIRQAGTGLDREAACAPMFLEVQDVTVAVISVDATQPHFAAGPMQPGTCYLDPADRDGWIAFFEARIPAARKAAHLVFVAVHWGANGRKHPDRHKRTLGGDMVRAGADAVLGSSAHVLQGVEVYRGAPIIHDAGDLLFDLGNKSKRDSAIFNLTLSRDGVRQVWITPLRSLYGRTVRAKGKRAAAILRKISDASHHLDTEVLVRGDRAVIDLAPRPRPHRTLEPRPPRGPIEPPPLAADELAPACVAASVPPEARLDPVDIGPLTLVGLRVRPEAIAGRQPLWVESFWTTEKPLTTDYWLATRLVSRKKKKSRPWVGDHEPCDWAWPTSRWEPGTIYRDFYALRPPGTLPEATMELRLGLFRVKGKHYKLKSVGGKPRTLKTIRQSPE
jgi:poly-gamma-glutamate capsule biosynthesis protein CapA/YwtB (metallophosphatase superfamily)